MTSKFSQIPTLYVTDSAVRQSNHARSGKAPLALALASALLVTAGTCAGAEAPFSFDSAPGRLPKNIVPLNYEISIEADPESMSFHGHESVTLEFRQASDRIVFNSLNEMVGNVTLDGQPVETVATNNSQQLTTVTLDQPAPAGQHTLAFAYLGQLESGPRGLFAQPYVQADGMKSVLLSTQFEATDARRMFPCWDEPAFRATFELTVTAPANWRSVSNMPVARRVEQGTLTTTTFERTPKMPTYLLELTSGDMDHLTGESGTTALGVWAVRGREQDGAEALANAQQILPDFNEYFGVRYPLPKLDSLAIPGGHTGAMENWGAITYNDRLLLVTDASALADRQAVFAVQAHEMAHLWNGDLVTMGWWDDIWLNESFASWMGAKETALRRPDWNWLEARDEAKESAMNADARVATHAIQQHVVNELQARNAFDPSITYAKGEVVLRMLEAYLGPDAFREGIRRYMKAHSYSNATTADLWNALTTSDGHDVRDVAADWTEQAGFPVVSVATTCDAGGARTATLSQRRFLLGGTDPQSVHWRVPLQVRVGADSEPHAVLLTKDGQTLDAGRCDQPLTINAGSIGYYRASYDPSTLSINTKSFGSLPRADRIAMLDDQWALVEAKGQELPTYLALVAALGDRLEERAWAQVVGALAAIEYDERGSPGHDAFTAYARSTLKPVAARLGWTSQASEEPGLQKLRHDVLWHLGEWGDPATVAEAQKRFKAFLTNRNAISAEDQETVLSIVAYHADAATFKQLHAVARTGRNETETRRLYRALFHVRDPHLAGQAARIALSPEIPPQLNSMRMNLIFELARDNPTVAWTTFTQNVDALMTPFASAAPLILALGCPETFWKSIPPEQIEAWVQAHVTDDTKLFVARGIETARFKLGEKTALNKAADRFIASNRSPPTASAMR
jgi:aminopeptidase N